MNSDWFFYTILVFIIFSSIILAIENPLNFENEGTLSNRVLSNIDTAISIIFILEVIIKVIARGFLMCGMNSYLRSYWNIIDFFVAITSFIAIFN